MWQVYIAMEMAGHGDLLEYIKLRGAIPEPKSKIMFNQLADAIHYLQSIHIIHRYKHCKYYIGKMMKHFIYKSTVAYIYIRKWNHLKFFFHSMHISQMSLDIFRKYDYRFESNTNIDYFNFIRIISKLLMQLWYYRIIPFESL